MTPPALMPCPFCGVLPMTSIYMIGEHEGGRVHCDHWECAVNPECSDTTLGLAIAWWNTRPAPPPNGEVEEAVETCRKWQQRDRVVDSVELSGAIDTLILAARSSKTDLPKPNNYGSEGVFALGTGSTKPECEAVTVSPQEVGAILAKTKSEWWREQWYTDFAKDLNANGLRIVKDKT